MVDVTEPLTLLSKAMQKQDRDVGSLAIQVESTLDELEKLKTK